VTAACTTSDFRNKALRALGQLPPFSPVLNRLLSSLAADDLPFSRLAALIEKDTVLAGSVLRIVNSALYGRQGTINSVTHAIAIMGLDKLRNVALSLSVSRIWKNVRAPRAFCVPRFNLHSVATGILADRLALIIPTSYPEGAFTAGLFHDLGKLLIAVAGESQYDKLIAIPDSACALQIELEREIFGCDHAELSSLALHAWNLPVAIRSAVAHHHSPDDCRTGVDGQFQWTLAHLIEAADQAVNLLGISLRSVPTRDEVTSFPLLDALGLSARIPELLREFQNEFATLRAVA
jgi:HD-like signal output (HDOD) protein